MTQAWKIREITVLFSPVGANFRRLCANFRRFILIGGVFTAILGIFTYFIVVIFFQGRNSMGASILALLCLQQHRQD